VLLLPRERERWSRRSQSGFDTFPTRRPNLRRGEETRKGNKRDGERNEKAETSRKERGGNEIE
jgi:hypothetical protein